MGTVIVDIKENRIKFSRHIIKILIFNFNKKLTRNYKVICTNLYFSCIKRKLKKAQYFSRRFEPRFALQPKSRKIIFLYEVEIILFDQFISTKKDVFLKKVVFAKKNELCLLWV